MTATMTIQPNPTAQGRDASPISRLMVLFFSDIVGSTDLKSRLGTVAYTTCLTRHDAIFRAIVTATSASEILKDTGDGFFASFATASDAVRAALRFQHELSVAELPLKTRIGIHVGELAELEKESSGLPKVVGLAADMTARVMQLAAGGQILLTRFAFNEARQFVLAHPSASMSGALPPLTWMAHGQYLFKGSDEPVEVFEVGAQGVAPMTAPHDGADARRCVRPGDEATLGWRPAVGLELPHRPNWIIREKLGEGGFGEVWLAGHAKTHSRRVFKFCFEPERLRGLKRELVLFRLLKDALGERRDIARVIDYQFDQPPYFIESEHVPSGNLVSWAQSLGGIDKVPLEMRIRIVADVADALSAAHGVGVLHKDIKPSNILIASSPDGGIHPVLTDFGIGILTDRSQLEKRDITMAGFTQTVVLGNDSSRTGTRVYAPPESLLDRPFTVQGDVYALGVLLYQMVIGELDHPLAEGWERDISEDLLRADIADCVQGDPRRRLSSAKELSDRLRNLEHRRAEQQRRMEDSRLAARRKKLVRALAIVAIVACGAAGALGLMLRERTARIAIEKQARADAEAATDRVRIERDKAVAVQDFLREMLGSIDPSRANKRDITVREVLDRAAERIDKGMKGQPEVEAVVRATVGATYLLLGLYPPAESQLKRSVELGRSTVGASHPVTRRALNDLAVVYLYTANFAAAEPLFLETLALREKLLGPEHPETADSLFNLALVYGQLGQHDKAVSYGRRALALREKLFGAESVQVAASLQYLGMAENNAGHYADAEPLLLRSLQMRERLLPADHIEIGNSRTNLGLVLLNEGKLGAAEQQLKSALAIFEKALDPDHPNVASVLNNLAVIYLRRKEYDQARQAATRAMEIQEKRLGPAHPDLALSLNALGGIVEGQGDYAGAQSLYDRAMGIAEKALGPDHAYTLMFQLNAALIRKNQGHPEQAIEMLRSVLAGFRKLKMASETTQAEAALVEAMIDNRQYAEVEPLALSLHRETEQLQTEELRTAQGKIAIELLVKLYERWDKPEQAAQYRGELQATSQPTTAPR